MIIIGHMLNFEGTHADVFEVFIQIGAILAIYTHYRRTFNGFLKRKNWIKHAAYLCYILVRACYPY